MRVVLDTNALVSALPVETALPAKLTARWRGGKFTSLSAEEPRDELSSVTPHPKIKERLNPALAGRLVNEIREVAMMVARLPRINISKGLYDDDLLAIAVAGVAHYLVTGDKADLLSLRQHDGTKIISVRDFLSLTGIQP